MSPPLVVLGDVLRDVDLIGDVTRQCPDSPDAPVLDLAEERARPGGAGLAALLAAADGVPVRLVTALADDDPGDALRSQLAAKLHLVAGRATGGTPVKCRLRSAGRSLARIDRGAGRPDAATPHLVDALHGAGAVLVSDYGRGMAADAALRAALTTLCDDVPVVWDPHPRGPAPVRGATLATPNLDEAFRTGGRPRAHGEDGRAPVTAAALAARRALVRWSVRAVAVTLGRHGALLAQHGGRSRLLPAPEVCAGDPCGAGDRFAASVAVGLLDGRDPVEAVGMAVAGAADFVARGGAAALSPPDGGAVDPSESLHLLDSLEPGELDTVERRRA